MMPLGFVFFFIFSKFWEGQRAKNGPKWQKTLVLSYISEAIHHDLYIDLSMNILDAGNKSPVQRDFFKNHVGNLLHAHEIFYYIFFNVYKSQWYVVEEWYILQSQKWLNTTKKCTAEIASLNKKAKAERKSNRDLKNLCLLPKNSAEGFGFRRGAIGVTYISMTIPLKNCSTFPKKVATTLLSGLRKGTVGAQ